MITIHKLRENLLKMGLIEINFNSKLLGIPRAIQAEYITPYGILRVLNNGTCESAVFEFVTFSKGAMSVKFD